MQEDKIQCFKNAKIFDDEKGFVQGSVYVQNGKIIQVIQDSISFRDDLRECEEIDCNGYAILPACIDINVFPLDKKLGAKPIHTLANKALYGGISTIFLNPYTQPSIDNEAMNALIESINSHNSVNIYPLIASTDSESRLSNIDTLHSLNKNAKAIFSNSAIGSNLLYQSMQYAKMLDLPLCVFAFDFNIEQGVAYESAFARGLGLPMITPIGQIKEVAKIKEMAKFLDIEVIFMSMNIAHTLDMICHEKNMHAQVGLPHLIFNEQSIKTYDTRYKMTPPLLTRSKKEKLVKRLQEGKVSLLTSMQQEVSKQYKEQVFEYASEGVSGIEYFFSLAYTLLVKEEILSMRDLVKLTSSNASNLMRLNKGHIATQRDADFMIVDLEEKFEVLDSTSLYHGLELYGKIKYMVVDGKLHKL
ncbi:MAG: amidohydrolase family protein [Helicobacter sp.]|uniref:amidohydrolase family protein n=1 Tax=Helicobacter sp. TaxID=218 RepID=UPI002A919D7E|nr:amidohydrolase family protein [Helicobacter sp.]MDY5949608.1 amidohydrolase family protein [Helicobacter sp.]